MHKAYENQKVQGPRPSEANYKYFDLEGFNFDDLPTLLRHNNVVLKGKGNKLPEGCSVNDYVNRRGGVKRRNTPSSEVLKSLNKHRKAPLQVAGWFN
jgi:hypothetical protein